MATVKYVTTIILIWFVSLQAQTGLPAPWPNRLTFYREVKAIRDSIVVHEDAYFKLHKKYFQGMKSDTLVRSIDSQLKRFDRTKRPIDQDTDWTSFGLSDVSVRGTYWVDVYDGPQGCGYVINVAIMYNDVTYYIAKNYGKESWRDTGLNFILLDNNPPNIKVVKEIVL